MRFLAHVRVQSPFLLPQSASRAKSRPIRTWETGMKGSLISLSLVLFLGGVSPVHAESEYPILIWWNGSDAPQTYKYRTCPGFFAEGLIQQRKGFVTGVDASLNVDSVNPWNEFSIPHLIEGLAGGIAIDMVQFRDRGLGFLKNQRGTQTCNQGGIAMGSRVWWESYHPVKCSEARQPFDLAGFSTLPDAIEPAWWYRTKIFKDLARTVLLAEPLLEKYALIAMLQRALTPLNEFDPTHPSRWAHASLRDRLEILSPFPP